MSDVNVQLSEEERQMVLMALAHLAFERPGWDSALASVALRIDNVAGGRPELYDRFRDLCRLVVELQLCC